MMVHMSEPPCIAFAGPHCLARGTLADAALAAKKAIESGEKAAILIFDGAGRQVDVDFRGSDADVVARLAARLAPRTEHRPEADAAVADVGGAGVKGEPAGSRGPGRPKLGVVAREVTLLPRHWDWLASQPGGASVALRKLVEAARRAGEDKDRLRQAQEAAYRFISVMAGDRAGFEEASRALFAGNRARFAELAKAWPVDIRDHAERLAATAFTD